MIGCHVLTRERYCDHHKRQTKQEYESTRLSAHQRGYTAQWRAESKAYLAEHPWCVECEKRGDLVRATLVDHVAPHKGNRDLFWDTSNWQSLCARHHNIKTSGEDGRWQKRENAPP